MRSILFLIPVLSYGLLGSAQAQVQFYTEPSFQGASARFDVGRFNTLGLGLAGKVSSIRIPPNYRVDVYGAPNLRGPSLTLNVSQMRLLLWNDRIQSARVYRIDAPVVTPVPVTPVPVTPVGQVRFFDGARYVGASNYLPVGSHGNLGPMDRRISSMQIPPGYTVTVYDRVNFRGNQLRFTQNTATLSPYAWDNRVRSIQISRTTAPPDNSGGISNRPKVYLFQDENFGGHMVALREGRYQTPGLQGLGQAISSIQVSAGYYARVYDNNRFTGHVQVLRGNVPQLNRIGWNDRIRSLEIVRE